MCIENFDYDPNKTSSYFSKANKFFVMFGLPGFLKWRRSGYSRSIYKHFQSVITVCIFIFIGMELGSLITQEDLSNEQTIDVLIRGVSQPILISYTFVMEYHKEEIRNLLYKLCIELKNVYNDPKVERQMIKKTKFYSLVYVLNLMNAMISYGFNGVLQVLRGGTFTTAITAWPDINDKSVAANIARVVVYLVWWICMCRICAVLILIVMTTGCICFQFKHVQSYLLSLNELFDAEYPSDTDHENVERKYEEALTVGIQLHADTLRCTKECAAACSFVYSAHILLNVFVICGLMLQMMNNERTLAAAFAIVLTAAALLTSSGIIMWNAGDVTFEAALIATALYSSGWQNCRGKCSQRVRKLLVISITQAQRPVVIRSFGIMEISYQAYVSMVKASYSAFSLLY